MFVNIQDKKRDRTRRILPEKSNTCKEKYAAVVQLDE